MKTLHNHILAFLRKKWVKDLDFKTSQYGAIVEAWTFMG